MNATASGIQIVFKKRFIALLISKKLKTIQNEYSVLVTATLPNSNPSRTVFNKLSQTIFASLTFTVTF